VCNDVILRALRLCLQIQPPGVSRDVTPVTVELGVRSGLA
jgi:hypothetical protein